jgi:hypothetical protein
MLIDLFVLPGSSFRSMVSDGPYAHSGLASRDLTFPHCAASSIGLSSAQGALYAALFNVASAVGRLAFGLLADFATGVC